MTNKNKRPRISSKTSTRSSLIVLNKILQELKVNTKEVNRSSISTEKMTGVLVTLVDIMEKKRMEDYFEIKRLTSTLHENMARKGRKRKT